MSLKRELQLTASPENLKEADDMKEGFLVLGFFFCLVCFGFFVNYPTTTKKKKKSLHDSPRKGLRGKEPENCWNTYSEERQTEERCFRSTPSQGFSMPVLLSFQTGNTSIFLSYLYIKKSDRLVSKMIKKCFSRNWRINWNEL